MVSTTVPGHLSRNTSRGKRGIFVTTQLAMTSTTASRTSTATCSIELEKSKEHGSKSRKFTHKKNTDSDNNDLTREVASISMMITHIQRLKRGIPVINLFAVQRQDFEPRNRILPHENLSSQDRHSLLVSTEAFEASPKIPHPVAE